MGRVITFTTPPMAELPYCAELAPLTTSIRATSDTRYWLKSTVEPVLAEIGKPSISTRTWSLVRPCSDSSKPDLPCTSRNCRPGTFSNASFSVRAWVRVISSRETTSTRTGTSSSARSVRVPVTTTGASVAASWAYASESGKANGKRHREKRKNEGDIIAVIGAGRGYGAG